MLRRKLFLQARFPRRYTSTAIVHNEEEYTSVPEYPPILEMSWEKTQERKKEARSEEIKKVKTVEEKQIKLNMPKFYGFKCYMIDDLKVPYNSLPLAQHITRTHLIETKELPEYYKSVNVDGLVEKLKSDIEEALVVETEGYKRRYEIESDKEVTIEAIESIFVKSLVKQLNRVVINNLSKEYKHISELQSDVSPRIESFWFAGGMRPPKNIKSYRRNVPWLKDKENDPTDRAIQFVGHPIMNLRHELPLKPIVAYDEVNVSDFPVPSFTYDPRTVGATTQHQHAANIPGFWPGEQSHFGLTSFHDRNFMHSRPYNDIKDDIEAFYRQGILSSFAWLNAQANFLGFTTFNDITYPLVNQAIITNGRVWSLFVYQMNTLLVHGKNSVENPRCNICWALPEQKLYESIADGKVVGLNEDLVKQLLQFYVNEPGERLGINFTPYLSQKEKVAADYEDDDKRQWLEREYKFLVSNRPRYKLGYELYHWEKIYKVDHKTMPMEARRRPFELFYKPSDRRLDDRNPYYIPRKLRPNLPRHKGRYEKEYFP